MWNNCLNDFDQIEGFDRSTFKSILTDRIKFLDTRNSGIADHSIDTYAKNGNSTRLGDLFVGGGDVAVRLLGSDWVALGPDYFTDETQTQQIAIAIHEALHIMTNMSDDQLALALKRFGYTPTKDSQDITDWIVGSSDKMSTTSGGCTKPESGAH